VVLAVLREDGTKVLVQVSKEALQSADPLFGLASVGEQVARHRALIEVGFNRFQLQIARLEADNI
jgi:hypothetical protein